MAKKRNIYRIRDKSIQHQFSESRNKLQIFAGGYANGKTTALAVKAIRLAGDYPGSNGLLARATYPKLNGTLRRVFFEWCPKKFIKKMPTKDENTVYFTNGSLIDFRYINQRGRHQADGQGTSNLLSATYDFIGIDQVEDPEITHKDLLDLLGRLRGDTIYRPEAYSDKTMPDTGPRFMMLTCNPTANWFFKEIVHPVIAFRDQKIKLDKLPVHPLTGKCLVDLFEGSTYTNAENLEEDFIHSLEAMYHGQMRERFLKGKWAAFEGLVYPDFDTQVHCITREQAVAHLRDCIRRHVQVQFVEAYDYGLSSPTVYMLAFVDDWGRVIVIDGFYKPNFGFKIDRHRAEIDTIRSQYTFDGKLEVGTDPINADPSIYKHKVIDGHSETGHTVSDLLEASGLKIRPANNDIISGIAKVGSYLADRDDIPHLLGERACGPLLYVVQELGWFQDEIVNYYWKRDSSNRQLDEPQEHDDHAMDDTKYLLSFLPPASDIKAPKDKELPQWMFWHEVDDSRRAA